MAIVAMSFGASAEDETQPPENSSTLETLLDEKLEFYRHLYPDILFLNLSGDELVASMMTLDILLGYEPESLDYEHPPKLRKDLMLVSVNRILDMLQSRMPSASLFKADEPLGWQENVCVLTIPPEDLAADSIRATQNLLGQPHEFIQKIPKDLRLSPADYLSFVVDHEIYHCLQSRYVGPQAMSHKELWGEYNHFHNELGADAYAIGMHIKNKGVITPFIINIQRIRGTALSTADPNHLTCKAVEQVLKLPLSSITEKSANEVFDMASQIKDSLTIGYDEYIQFMASAIQAMKELDVEAQVSDEMRNIVKQARADPEQVKELVKNTRRCLSELGASEENI